MNESSPNMLGIFEVLKKWRRPIILLVMVSTVIAAIISLLLPKKYASTAVIFPVNSMLSDKSRLFNANIQQLYSEYGGSDDLDHLYAIANSNAVIRFITDSFHLSTHYKVNESPDKAKYVAGARFKKNTDITKSENGELRIEVWDEDNNMAANIAAAMLIKIQEMSTDIMWQSAMATLHALKRKQFADTNQVKQGIGSSSINRPMLFEKEIKELEVSLEAAPPVFVTLEKPTPAFEPGKPNIWVIIITTFLLSTFFAITTALFVERLTR